MSSTSSMAHLNDSHSWAVVKRDDRAALAIRGRDALTFLQNLTTNDTRFLKTPHDAQHTCFLNQKGRSIFEAALVLSSTSKPEEPHLLVETAAEQAPDLLAHLKRSRVRAKVELLDLTSSYSVTSVLHTDPFAMSTSSEPMEEQGKQILEHLRHILPAAQAASPAGVPPTAKTPEGPAPPVASPIAPQPFSGSAAFLDPRNRTLGMRVIAPSSLDVGSSLGGLKHAPLHHFQGLRVLLGIPEGKEVSDVIPLEWNLPYLNAVSFAKGCYLGQELIARGHFRGLIRKRFVPVYFSPGGAPARPVACANTVSALLVRQTDDAMLRRTRGQAPGGQGHGKGHGPSQKHDFPQSQATGHYVPHSKLHGEMANVKPAIPGNTSPANATHRIRLPFPFVDLDWRGEVEIGTSLSTGEGVANGSTGAAAGERIGKIVGWVPGTNLGLVNLRLEHIAHTFPQGGTPTTNANAAARATEAEEKASESTSDSSLPSPTSATVRGYDDSGQDHNQACLDLYHRCQSQPVNFKVPAAAEATKAAGDANVTGKGHHGITGAGRTGESYHVTPILPPFWYHIPHAGVEENVTVKGAATAVAAGSA
jgi:folate-binding protein YgfZ